LSAVATVAELGDVTRLSSSGKAVRFAGLDSTVSESDIKRSRGYLSRQGPPVLRRTLYEAATSAWRKASPITSTTCRPRAAWGPSGRACRLLGACCAAPITCSPTWARLRSSPRA